MLDVALTLDAHIRSRPHAQPGCQMNLETGLDTGDAVFKFNPKTDFKIFLKEKNLNVIFHIRPKHRFYHFKFTR